MARCPFAQQEILPENARQAHIRPTQIIHHVSAGESTDLHGFWTSPGEELESHFYVNRAGRIIQYMDTEVMAEANLTANRRPDGSGAISIETQGADAGGPWDVPQAASLVRLDRWLIATHGIPVRLCRTSSDPGLGWHVMFGAPGPWTPAKGKICPGPARIQQIKTLILPTLISGGAVATGDWFDMADKADLQAVVRDELTFAVGAVTALNSNTRYDVQPGLRLALAKVDTLTAQVEALTAKVDALKLTGGAVNVAALATAVADLVARRLVA